MSLLSVVVPFYNVEHYLAETLSSISRQTHDEMQIILVNDGSTDDSRSIAIDFVRADRRFMLIEQENGGLSNARNNGALHAEGEFLAFADSDDLVPRYAYRLMINTLKKTGSEIAAGGVRRYTSAGASISPMHKAAFAETRLRTHITRQHELIRDWTAWNKMYRRSFYEGAQLAFPEGIQYEDAPVTVRAYLQSASTDVLAPPVYYWRLREQGPLSITQRVSDPGFFLDRIASMSLVSKVLENDPAGSELRVLYETTAIDHHYPLMIKAIAGASDDVQTAFIEASRTYLQGMAPGVTDELTKRLREQVGELIAGRLPAPPNVTQKLVLATTSTTTAKPEAVRAAKATLRHKVGTRVDDVKWDGNHIIVRGHANAVGGTMARFQPISARLMWLRELGTRRLIRLSIRPVRRPSDPLGADAHRAAFEVHLDPAMLKTGDRWQPGTWRFAVAFVDHRGLRSSGLRTRQAGLIALPEIQLDATTRLVPSFTMSMLTLDIVNAPVTLDACTVVNGALRIDGRIVRKQVTAANLRFSRVDGVVDHTVPVKVGTDNADTTFVVEMPLDDVVATLGPVDLAPVGGASDTWRLALEYVAGQKYTRGIAAGMAPGTMHMASGYLASIHTNPEGMLCLTVRPPIPAATSLAWDEDTALRMTGVGPVGPGDEIVLRMRRQREYRRWPIVPNPDGTGWTATVTPLAAVTAAGALPLRPGTWNILLSAKRENGSPYMTNLPISPPAMAAIGPVAPSHDRTFWLKSVGVDGASIRTDNVRLDDVAHRVAQVHLRDVWYPQARVSEPLTNTVVYMSFGGRQYSDSPRAVHEELVRRGSAMTHLWMTKDDQVLLPPTVREVRMYSQEWYLALATAKFLVVNSHLPSWFRRRDDQIVVQTWHGTPLKKIGLDIDDPRFADRTYQQKLIEEVPNWSYLVSPNSFSTPHMTRAFGYTGEFLETGYPRNDILFKGEQPKIRKMLEDRLDIPTDKKIILYAPTWRDDQFYSGGRYKFDARLDFDSARDALSDEYVLLVRRHPNVVDDVPGAGNGFVWDVSTYPDIADLMAVTDVLLTDYSSMMFDFAVTGRPIVFFTYDLEHYRDKLRGFYFDFESTAPGPLLATSEQVVAALRDVDSISETYRARYDEFRSLYCDFDDGKATVRVVDTVFGIHTSNGSLIR